MIRVLTSLVSCRPTNTFRLINVKHKNVVEFRNVRLHSLRYLALSYVWGGPQSFTATTTNDTSLLEPGSLERGTPRTISDAMHFTNILGIEYLEVDTLCIIQEYVLISYT